jgi:hypothetical protein
MRFLMSILVALILASVPIRAETLPPEQKTVVEGVITSQLQAFSRDDAAGAYSFAAPLIQNIFPNSDTFMAMVKRGYPPVYRHESVQFGESFTDQLGRPAQRVTLTTADGKRYEAIYTMELQPDGTWKIAGCTLTEVQPLDA